MSVCNMFILLCINALYSRISITTTKVDTFYLNYILSTNILTSLSQSDNSELPYSTDILAFFGDDDCFAGDISDPLGDLTPAFSTPMAFLVGDGDADKRGILL